MCKINNVLLKYACLNVCMYVCMYVCVNVFFLFCLIFDADCYDDFNLSFSDSVGTGTLDFESVFNYSVSIFVFIGRFAAFIDFHITG